MQQQMSIQPRYTWSDDDKRRQQAIADAWQAYDGLLPPQLQKTPEGIDPNVNTNRIRPIVNGVVNFLFGKPVGITCDEGAPQEAQDFLEQVWGKNEKRLPLLQDVATNGALASRAFLRIVPNKAGDTFRLVVVDPSLVAVQTAPQDCSTVLLYCIEYCSSESVNGKDVEVYYHEEIQRVDPDGNTASEMEDDDDTWIINHWTRVGDIGPWSLVGEPIPWPYPFAPIFSCKNRPRPNCFWGTCDITADLIDMNKAINLALSCMQLNNIIYGQPLLYATGVGESELDRKPGKIATLPLPESKIDAVQIPTDLANQLAYVADLRSDMDELSGVPATALGRFKDIVKGQIAGITMELMFQVIIMATETKRCLYGEMIIDVSKALLGLGKFSPDIEVSLQWQDPLPDDDLASVQAALAKQQLGVSNATLIQELGYDPDEEMDKSNAENAQAVTNFSRGQGMPPQMMQDGQPAPEQPAESPFLGRA